MSGKRPNKSEQRAKGTLAGDSNGQAALEQEVHQALRAMGWVVPQDGAAVQAVESKLAAEAITLPEALRDADAALRGLSQAVGVEPRPIAFGGDSDIEAGLARAAREGGTIPPKVEELMRRDRQAAERELDDGQVDAS